MTDDHLSLDELAELDEGILMPDRATAAQAHLAGCARCRESAEALTATRARLAALPAEQMPAPVAARLDRALADAAAGTTTLPSNVTSLPRRRFGHPTLAASAAAAVVVLAIGAIIVGHAMNGTSSESGGSAGATAAGPRTPAQPKNYVKTSTGLTYTPSRLLADVPGLVSGVSGTAVAAGRLATPESIPQPSATDHSTPTGVGALAHQAVPAALGPLYNSRTRLLQCAAYLSGIPHAVPLAVDFGRWTNGPYHASPSAIFVFRDPNSNVVDVYVTGPTCSGTDAVRIYDKVPLN